MALLFFVVAVVLKHHSFLNFCNNNPQRFLSLSDCYKTTSHASVVPLAFQPFSESLSAPTETHCSVCAGQAES